jgi:SAM-dependent methyltransferase
MSTAQVSGARRFLNRILGIEDKPAPVIAEPPIQEREPQPKVLKHRRYLSDQPQRTEAFLNGATAYVGNLTSEERQYLYEKPFERLPGSPNYFRQMYALLNLLEAMKLPAGARILEVGSGPGWVTEILLGLGFEVDALDPCSDMIAIAEDRTADFLRHHRLPAPANVHFHCASLEDCPLPDQCCDGVLFFQSLHHIIDEHRGLAQSLRVLKPGGILGTEEGPWTPGNRDEEEMWDKEMERFGTLENPYTPEYLDHVLKEAGFINIQRYHSINGYVPAHLGSRSVIELAQIPASCSNALTAQKAGAQNVDVPTTANSTLPTLAEIEVLDAKFNFTARRLTCRVRLRNTGKTLWVHEPRRGGFVTMTVRQGEFGTPSFAEALYRYMLPQEVLPGQELVVDVPFELPKGNLDKPWYLDLVNEGVFWFSTRGSKAVELRFAGDTVWAG